MPNQEDIDGQLDLLAAHRRTLTHYLNQQAQLGTAHSPPGVMNGILQTRAEILRIKDNLRKWNLLAEDHPIDEDYSNYSVNKTTSLASSTPPLPPLLIGRDRNLRDLKLRLGVRLNNNQSTSLQSLIVMRGWPGVGKTTLAATLAHDHEVHQAFPDGVLWASLGLNPNLFAELANWGRTLGIADLTQVRTIESVSAQLSAILRDQRRLLILDDVWDPYHVEPFRIGGRKCALLVTTRLPEVAQKIIPTAADEYVLEVLTERKALELLETLAPRVVVENPEDSLALVQDLEGLPLAIQVAGRLLHAESSYGFGVMDLLTEIREAVKILEAQAPADRAEISKDTIPTVAVLLQKSTDILDMESRECFAYLGAFAAKPATFDQAAMQSVWNLDDPKPMIRTLVDRGLLEPVGPSRFWMHALLVKHANSFLTK